MQLRHRGQEHQSIQEPIRQARETIRTWDNPINAFPSNLSVSISTCICKLADAQSLIPYTMPLFKDCVKLTCNITEL